MESIINILTENKPPYNAEVGLAYMRGIYARYTRMRNSFSFHQC